MGSFMYGLKKTEVTCICDNVYVITDRAGCCVNLVTGKEKALVFDTGSGTDDIHGLVRGITGLPLVVINSHGHFDHIGAALQIARAFTIPIYASETEDGMLADTSLNLTAHFTGHSLSFHADRLVHDGDELELLGYKWKVIATPGHTAGSVCYYLPEEEVLLSGDTLFQDSYGRTDLPTGSSRALVDSVLRKLFILPGDTMVYPGHGEPTTIGYEAQNNPIACYR